VSGRNAVEAEYEGRFAGGSMYDNVRVLHGLSGDCCFVMADQSLAGRRDVLPATASKCNGSLSRGQCRRRARREFTVITKLCRFQRELPVNELGCIYCPIRRREGKEAIQNRPHGSAAAAVLYPTILHMDFDYVLGSRQA